MLCWFSTIASSTKPAQYPQGYTESLAVSSRPQHDKAKLYLQGALGHGNHADIHLVAQKRRVWKVQMLATTLTHSSTTHHSYHSYTLQCNEDKSRQSQSARTGHFARKQCNSDSPKSK